MKKYKDNSFINMICVELSLYRIKENDIYMVKDF